MHESLTDKIILVTGATDGIGLETAYQLAGMGARIILHGRNEKKTIAALEQIKTKVKQTYNKEAAIDRVVADFSSLREVATMAALIKEKYTVIDVLLNNAGVFCQNREITEDGFEMSFAVNHLAHFLLTTQLLGLLRKGSRIINVSSMAHAGSVIDFSDLNMQDYDGYTAYSRSKLANILFTYTLAEKLIQEKITVNALHPGVITTKLLQAGWGGIGNPSLADGAALSVMLASAPELNGITGKYFSDMREKRSSKASYDKEMQKHLWEISEKLTTPFR